MTKQINYILVRIFYIFKLCNNYVCLYMDSSTFLQYFTCDFLFFFFSSFARDHVFRLGLEILKSVKIKFKNMKFRIKLI